MSPQYGESMATEVIYLKRSGERSGKRLRQQIAEILAMLRAIEAGELLAALPECEQARANHQTALKMLAVAERDLVLLQDEVGRLSQGVVRPSEA